MEEARKSTGLALVKEERASLGMTGGVQINGLRDVFALAERLANARGFVPDAYAGKPEALAACILTGVELGLGPMTAMREIHIIKGKPSISATLMLALARRAGVKTRWLKTDPTAATIGVTVPGQPEQTLSFTAEQAKAAGLWGQGNWKTYPDAMLRARATSAAIRAFCPDVIGGSVYESESGEITGGVPAEQAIEATVVDTRREQPAPKPAESSPLDEIQTGEDLLAYCAEHRDALAASKNGARERRIAKISETAARVGYDPAAALEAAGLA